MYALNAPQQFNPDDYTNQALGRINQYVRSGTYGEGRISQAATEFKNLEDMMRSGQISQKDYVSAASKLRDATQPILNQVMNGGSAAATAGSQAGAQNLAQNYFRNIDIYKSAQDVLGRDLTPTEFAKLAPTFGSGSQKEIEAGRGYLAQLADQEANSPQALDKKYQASAGQYGGQVNDLFQQMLGRAATADEQAHFGKMLASGQTDPYELQQFMTQLPEYRDAQDAAAQQKQAAADAASRDQLNTSLQAQDLDFFNKAKENVISRFAQNGTLNSPSLDFALTNLMGDIQKQRSAYMAQLARQDYANEAANTRQDYLANKDLLRQDYTNSMNQMLDTQNYNRNLATQNASNALNRSYDIADYTTQRNDLLDQMNRLQQTRRQSHTGQLVGGLLGAGIGAFGGPMGAMAGYQIGSGLGGGYDYLNY